jgi:glycosyltransferase involved in cell wall biosynthesis
MRSIDPQKNFATQFIAACTIPNAVIHTTFQPDVLYSSRCPVPVIVTGVLSRGLFLLTLSKMDVVLYASLSEAYPLVVLEAMALGVPPVVSHTHHVLDDDLVLKSTLVVEEADNPESVALRISAAIPLLDELRLRLQSLVHCLRLRGEIAWGTFLELSSEEARQLQLDAYADTIAGASPPNSSVSSLPPICSAGELAGSVRDFPPPPLLSPMGQSSGIDNMAIEGKRIAFITYELSPGNPGGAGVVISNLVSMLLESGFKVTVLAHTSEGVLEGWTQHMVSEGWKVGGKQQLTIHHVPTLVDEDTLAADKCHPRNIFLRRSRLFALAARKAYDLDPFDALEVFEYAGAAFELLRSAKEWEYGVPRGLKVPEPYLPSHVPVLLRLHGSIQLIAQAEGGVDDNAESFAPRPCLDSDDEAAASPLMHLMERYALQTAHVLLPQSRSMQDVYEKAYGLTSERMLVAPPPMGKILISVLAKDSISGALLNSDTYRVKSLAFLNNGGKSVDKFSLKEGHFLKSFRGLSDEMSHHTPFQLLIYGRVAKMKGAETVAYSASIIQSLLPPSVRLHLIFAGLDWMHPKHRKPTSNTIRNIIPKDFIGTYEFLGEVPRSHLKELCETVHGGIFASEFETFGLAAHELAALSVPLIVSNIPAYAEFFPPSSAYVFETGNATSLAQASLRLLWDLKEGKPKLPFLKYGDPISPYIRIAEMLHSYQGKKFPYSSSYTRLTEVSLARLEEKCWPSMNCSFMWGRN